MAVIGSGNSHGACSLLHAAGTGYGASVSLDLPVIVKALDRPSKRQLNDPDDLLGNVVESWLASGLALPDGMEKGDIHWAVASKIPPRRGLKSSAAISIAAVKALCEATESELSDSQIVAISSQSQINAGVSITGSIDDSNAETIDSSVVMEGPGLNPDDWIVLLACRDERPKIPELEDFIPFYQEFEKALIALQQGEILNCLTINGRAVCGVLNDLQGRKFANDAFLAGARAAGMTGSGPAIVIIIPSLVRSSADRIISNFSKFLKDDLIVETKFLSQDNDEIDSE